MKTFPFLLIMAVLLAVVRVYLVSGANLFQDEALYVWLSQKAPLNFTPHPPGTPLLTLIGLELFGQREFAVRFGSLVLGSLMVFPLYALAAAIGGPACARWTVLAYTCTPIYVVFGAISTPDMPQLFLFVVALYCTWQALESGATRWWLASGAVLAIGLHFKYIIVLYFPSLLLAMWMLPVWKRHLRTPGPYLLGLMVLVLFGVVAAWRDSQLGWSALRYHLRDRQESGGISLEDGLIYQLAHVAFYSPLLYGLAVWAMFKALRAGRRDADPRLLFLGAFATLPWLFFAVIAVWTERDLSREQWDALAYIPAYIAGGIFLQRASSTVKLQRLRIWAPALGLATLAILTVEVKTSVITGALDRDPLFTKVYGWRTLNYGVDKHIEAHFSPDEKYFVLADSFAPALELAFYSDNRYPVYTLPADRNTRYGLNEVLEMTGASVDHLQEEMGTSALVLLESKMRVGTVTTETESLARMFETVEEKRRIPIFHRDERLRVFRVFKGTRLKDPAAFHTSNEGP